jgi:hypothetical protein
MARPSLLRLVKAEQRADRVPPPAKPINPVLQAWVRSLSDDEIDRVEEALALITPSKPKRGEPR